MKLAEKRNVELKRHLGCLETALKHAEKKLS